MKQQEKRQRLIRAVADIGIIKGVAGGTVETLDPADYAAIEKAALPSAVVFIYQRDDGGWIAEHRDYGKVGGRGSEGLVRALHAWGVVE